MIHCHKCKAINPSTASICQQCQANLLPAYVPDWKRVVPGILFGGVAFISGIWVMIGVHEFAGGAAFMGIGVLMGAILALSNFALSQAERYTYRARRHIHLDMEQALADFSKAIDLTSNNDEKRKLMNERIEIQAKTDKTSTLQGDVNALEAQLEHDIQAASGKAKHRLLNERAAIYQRSGKTLTCGKCHRETLHGSYGMVFYGKRVSRYEASVYGAKHVWICDSCHRKWVAENIAVRLLMFALAGIGAAGVMYLPLGNLFGSIVGSGAFILFIVALLTTFTSLRWFRRDELAMEMISPAMWQINPKLVFWEGCDSNLNVPALMPIEDVL